MLDKLRYFFCFFLTCIFNISYSADTLIIYDEAADYFLINEYIDILEDKNKEYTIDNIQDPELQKQFQPNKYIDRFAFIENTSSAYWIRFYIKGGHPLSRRFILENLDQHIDYFQFYKPSGNSYTKAEAGFAHEFAIREYIHKNFVFDIPIDTTITAYYIRVESRNHNPFLFKVRSTHYFTYYALNEYFLLGIFYGLLALMGIYNLLLFFSVKESVYIYYFIYVSCCALISLQEDGMGFQYLWPGFPEFNPYIEAYSPLILILSFSLYSKVFLELKKNLPKFNTLFNYAILIYVVFFFLDTYILKLESDFPFYFFPFLVIYIAAILCLKKGYKPARYYLVGYSFMMIGIIFLILRITFIINTGSILMVYSFDIGLIFEIVILSFSLSDRFKILKKEKEQAQENIILQLKENEKLKDKVNRELEAKVAERTIELRNKNEELEEVNEELKTANEQLEEKNIEMEEAYELLRAQAIEIKRMNEILNKDNKSLKSNVDELVSARIFLKKVDFDEFKNKFPDKNSCLQFLHDLKWKDGYKCKKCGYTGSARGKDGYSLRCNRCRYIESPTVHTIFHNLKFPIEKAFYIVFLMHANRGHVTVSEVAEHLSLRVNTCWLFSKKVAEALNGKGKKARFDNPEGWTSILIEETPNLEESKKKSIIDLPKRFDKNPDRD